MSDKALETTSPNRSGNGYRFNHFHAGIALRDFGFSRDSLGPGDRLPDMTLVDTDGNTVGLADFTTNEPIVIVTGSITCPLTVSALPDLDALERRFGDRVRFVLLQVREAHPGGHKPQPQTMTEKIEHARALREAHRVEWPVLVDDIDGTLHRHLDALANSLHIVAPDGTILYRALFAGDDHVEAIASVASGNPPTPSENRHRARAILKSVGFMHDVLRAAGWRAYADVALTAPPLIGLALGTKLFRSSSARSEASRSRRPR